SRSGTASRPAPPPGSAPARPGRGGGLFLSCRPFACFRTNPPPFHLRGPRNGPRTPPARGQSVLGGQPVLRGQPVRGGLPARRSTRGAPPDHAGTGRNS